MEIHLIWAQDSNGGIGKNGKLPWHISEDLKNQADLLLSFGKQTWPHMMARVMLLEQIYRAQQIRAGHPYHRE